MSNSLNPGPSAMLEVRTARPLHFAPILDHVIRAFAGQPPLERCQSVAEVCRDQAPTALLDTARANL